MTASPMRVAFFGNVVNCLYQIAVALRESGDIEPHLYVSSDDPITGRPEGVDPELFRPEPKRRRIVAEWLPAERALARAIVRTLGLIDVHKPRMRSA